MKAALVDTDFLDDAVILNCEPVLIRTVFNVESQGYGYDPEDFPKTLLEAHHFHRLTGGKYDKSHPDLSRPTWTKGLYKDWRGEKDRLARACALDREAALQSASWGAPQIMGFNWKATGSDSLQHFINRMCYSHNEQLALFTQLLMSWGLEDELRSCRWDEFTARYNGKGQVAYYSGKLKAEYAKLCRNHK